MEWTKKLNTTLGACSTQQKFLINMGSKTIVQKLLISELQSFLSVRYYLYNICSIWPLFSSVYTSAYFLTEIHIHWKISAFSLSLGFGFYGSV